MSRRTVALKVGSREYKLTSSASEAELAQLASTVSARLAAVVPPGRPEPPNALLLVALALAHDLEDERARTRTLERRSRDMLRRVLLRLDNVLDHEEAGPAGR